MEIKENNNEFQKGFNEGYLLAKHNHELADKIADALRDTERGQGFKEGCKEFSKEKDRTKLPDWLKNDRLENLDKTEPGKEKEVTKE